MELSQLQALGGYSPRGLIKKDIALKRPPLKPESEWADPSKPESDDLAPKSAWVDDVLTVHIRKRSSADAYEVLSADGRSRPFVMILRCICHENGLQVFENLEQVEQLKEWLWMPLAMAASEVNDLAPKKSRPMTSGGAASRSPSADDQSRSGKRRSAKRSVRSGSRTKKSGAALTHSSATTPGSP